jgi:hypothetical protein
MTHANDTPLEPGMRGENYEALLTIRKVLENV